MAHKNIANWLHEHSDMNGWWCQSVAVAYEQRIGRRKPGQTCEGDFAAGVSRTVDGDLDDVLARWLGLVAGATGFNGVALLGEPATRNTGSWRYWRARLADGSRVSVNISAKSAGRAVFNLDHNKLPDGEHIDDWKAFWRKLLAGL